MRPPTLARRLLRARPGVAGGHAHGKGLPNRSRPRSPGGDDDGQGTDSAAEVGWAGSARGEGESSESWESCAPTTYGAVRVENHAAVLQTCVLEDIHVTEVLLCTTRTGRNEWNGATERRPRAFVRPSSILLLLLLLPPRRVESPRGESWTHQIEDDSEVSAVGLVEEAVVRREDLGEDRVAVVRVEALRHQSCASDAPDHGHGGNEGSVTNTLQGRASSGGDFLAAGAGTQDAHSARARATAKARDRLRSAYSRSVGRAGRRRGPRPTPAHLRRDRWGCVNAQNGARGALDATDRRGGAVAGRQLGGR